jgi:predicted MFS family arabinose efflux permease
LILIGAVRTKLTLFSSENKRVFIPFALAYFLSYFYRVVNAVISPNLTADLNIGPADLGLLTSTYFIAFASFQLPLGVLLDRFGPRRIETGLLLFAAAGALTFGLATGLLGLSAGRALIGLGVSSGYMAAIKAYTLWFQPHQWSRINGLHLAAGGFGALSATLPVEWLLGITGWRGVFIILSMLTILVAGIIFWVVPEREQESEGLSLKEQLQGVAQVFTNRWFWKIAPVATISQAAAMAIQGLWIGPWLRDMAGLDRHQMAGVLFWASVSMTAGFVIIGFLTERLSRIGIKALTSGLWAMFIFMVSQVLLLVLPREWAVPLWIFFGFMGTSGAVLYPALAMHFPAKLAGRVSTGLNVLVFGMTFLAQWGIGAVIGLFPLTASGGYSPQGYQRGFTILLVLQVLGLAWALLSDRILLSPSSPYSQR